MDKYIVYVREVWTQPVEVEANSAGEAKEKIYRGEGVVIEDRFEFSDYLDSSSWTVEKIVTVSAAREKSYISNIGIYRNEKRHMFPAGVWIAVHRSESIRFYEPTKSSWQRLSQIINNHGRLEEGSSSMEWRPS